MKKLLLLFCLITTFASAQVETDAAMKTKADYIGTHTFDPARTKTLFYNLIDSKLRILPTYGANQFLTNDGTNLIWTSNLTFNNTTRNLLIGSNTASSTTNMFVNGAGNSVTGGGWGIITGENNVSTGGGGDAIIGGQNNTVNIGGGLTFGYYNVVNGAPNSFVGGAFGKTNSGSSLPAFVFGLGGNSTGNEVTANPEAVNVSGNTGAQTAGHGSLAPLGVILGGRNHNIPVNSNRSAIIGGDGIKARAGETDQVYVPNFNINTKPTRNDTLNQILARDSVTGKVMYVKRSSLGGGGGAFWPLGGTADLTSDFSIYGYGSYNLDLQALNLALQGTDIYLGAINQTHFNGGIEIVNKPVRNDTLNQILARDSTTGAIRFVKRSSLGGGGGSGYIPLGGTVALTNNLAINGGYDFSIGVTGETLPNIAMSSISTMFLSTGGVFGINSGSFNMSGTTSATIAGGTSGIGIDDTGSEFTNEARYLADYSAGFTDRSLVDKEYVDNAVAGGGGSVDSTKFWKTNSDTQITKRLDVNSSNPFLSIGISEQENLIGFTGFKLYNSNSSRANDRYNRYDTLTMHPDFVQWYVGDTYSSTPGITKYNTSVISMGQGNSTLSINEQDSVSGYYQQSAFGSGTTEMGMYRDSDDPAKPKSVNVILDRGDKNDILIGNGTLVTSGTYAIAMGGGYSTASGDYTFSGGVGTGSRPVRTTARAGFSWYESTASQTNTHGNQAANAVILGGQDHNIPSTATGSVVLGGNAIKVSASVTNTTHTQNLRIGTNSYFGSFSVTPTAKVHIGAGTIAAGTAPLKIASGSLMTTAEVGAIEFLTDKYYATITTGAARKELTLNDAALTSGRMPFVTTNGRLIDDASLVYSTSTGLGTSKDVVLNTAGAGLKIKEGTNATMGTATLTAGTVTISTTKVTANSRVMITSQVDGGTPGFLRVSSRTAGTSFVITSSSATDTSVIAWVILEPAP